MSQLADIIETNAECLDVLRDRMQDAPQSSAYEAALSALTRARQALIAAAFQQNDPDAIAALTPDERGSLGQPDQEGAPMSRATSKLVKKAKKVKAKNPGATVGDVFGALADEAAAEGDPIAREALSTAGAADTIAKMRRRAGLL